MRRRWERDGVIAYRANNNAVQNVYMYPKNTRLGEELILFPLEISVDPLRCDRIHLIFIRAVVASDVVPS